MAAAEGLEWRRAVPVRALRRLGWFLLGAAALVAVAWVLFGTEPDRLSSGEPNPLAAVPVATTVAVVVLAVPFLVALVRRPILIADHYALSVRPGALRIRVLPWASVVEITAMTVRDDPMLLMRCTGHRGHLGDRLSWCDQAVLRSAVRAAGARRAEVGAHDLGLRLDEFSRDPRTLVASLAAWAPAHVLITDELDSR